MTFDDAVCIIDMRSAEGECVSPHLTTTHIFSHEHFKRAKIKQILFTLALAIIHSHWHNPSNPCQVALSAPVDPNGGAEAGLVELWLLKLETVMRDSLKSVVSPSISPLCFVKLFQVLISASANFAAVPRVEFVLSWPSQIVLNPSPPSPPPPLLPFSPVFCTISQCAMFKFVETNWNLQPDFGG